MANNRKDAEHYIISMIAKMDPSGMNANFLKTRFAHMTDKQFDAYMTAVENGDDYISVIAPNLEEGQMDTARNIALAKEWGVELFHHLWLTDAVTGMTYKTKYKHLCLWLPIRRQIQTLKNKMSVPEDNKHVDDLTDQPTGASKGSEELIKFRGGDLTAMRAMDKMIHDTGGARMETFYHLNSRAKATTTFSILLKGMHLDNNA